jgi:predicted AAA+ superfamily ATPase
MEAGILRIFKPLKDSYFLFGPRGVGKTTFLRQNYDGALWIDLLNEDMYRILSANPEKLIEIVKDSQKKIIIIDEVQKVPELLSAVHLLIEEHSGLQFIITGSSSRKIKKNGVDLLAGRALKEHLHPFMACELKDRFDLNKAVTYGLIPVVIMANDPEKTAKSYASLYVKEEVQQEGLVRNIGDFARFLESISFSHGSVLNISNVARDCQVERKTVEGYVNILEDLMLACRLPVFTKKAKRGVINHSKFYFFDAGLFRALRPSGPLDNPSGIDGVAFEGIVLQHLAAWNSYSGDKNKIYYFRTKKGSEVDFILYGKDNFTAIEVKSSGKARDEDLRSLRAFLEDYPECKGVFVYRGKERLKKGDILCMPAEEFLKGLDPSKASII